MVMKKYYFAIISLLVLVLGLTSCSDEEPKTPYQIAARPTVPIQNGEVQIGTQVWMTKNLNVSRYRNGDIILQVTDTIQWRNLSTGAWCYYANNTANGTIYGKLYNWYAVNDSRQLAPTGYHVPSDAEWNTLITFLGGQPVAGGKMKTTTLWNSPNAGANNSSGFTGLPGGLLIEYGTFNKIGIAGYWWSTTELNATFVRYCALSYDHSYAFPSSYYKTSGFSVRCLRD